MWQGWVGNMNLYFCIPTHSDLGKETPKSADDNRSTSSKRVHHVPGEKCAYETGPHNIGQKKGFFTHTSLLLKLQ